MRVAVVLQEFTTPGNIGAVARAMKNFGFSNLILLNPKCNHLEEKAKGRAMHAVDILKKAKKIKKIEDLKGFNYIIATSSKLGRDYNIPRLPLKPEEIPEKVNGKVAIIIGREGIGMKNSEIKKCDFLVAIPTSKKYPAMNVSHAATVLLYEISKASKREKITSHIKPASRQLRKALIRLADSAIARMEFSTEERKTTQKRLWRSLVGKCSLTRREAFAMCGFFRKIK
ncbi:MAG: TrmJ/YjtD family RNA methyltransferase [Candidatus Woesearchaeota archaeon]